MSLSSFVPPMKKQKLTNDFSQSTEISNYFEELFYYDWFLIELGRKLMNKNDSDLLNILVLNKKINERATIVFRKHFLNFQLQNEVIQLTTEKQFEKIQQHFTLSNLSLNPNVFFHFESLYFSSLEIIQCVHFDVKLLLTTPKHLIVDSCNCKASYSKKIPLILIASRLEMFSLFEMILFHPRFEWKTLTDDQQKEILNRVISKNQLEIVHFILTDLRFRTNSNESVSLLSQLDWSFAAGYAIFHSNIDLFELLESKIKLLYFKLKIYVYYIELCEKGGGGGKMFEKILHSPLFGTEDELGWILASILESASNFEFCGDYVQEIVKLTFDLSIPRSVFEDSGDDIDLNDVMRLLSQVSDKDKRNAKISMSFAFCCAFKFEFSALISERKWEDDELLELFRTVMALNDTTHEELVKILLEHLSPNANILESQVESFLELEADSLSFFAIWNDKRFSKNRTEKWTQRIILKKLPEASCDFFENVCNENCFPSSIVSFQLQLEKDLIITTEFRNQLWLTLLRDGAFNCLERLNALKKSLNIKFPDELLDWALIVTREPTFLLNFKSEIPSSFWNLKRIHTMLLKSCDPPSLESIKLLVQEFPNVDFSWNDNELLRTLLNSNYNISLIFEKFFEKAKLFKNVKEREEFVALARKSPIQCYFDERISKMSV